jgi:UPF0716 protein FxsA
MRFVVLAIVLAFPLLDLFVTARFARWTGVPIWIWLGVSTFAGFFLLHNERLAFRKKTLAAMHGEQSLLRGLLDSGRKVLAGFLFLLPGIVSDLFALLLLALPLNVGNAFGPRPATAGRARGRDFDGDYRRVD